MSYTLMPGDRAPNFEGLKGTDGKLYGLKKLDSDLFKVLFFTCNHCPYVTGSDELTRNIAEKFKNKVEFIAINSNSENTYEEDAYENMVLRMKEFNLPKPLIFFFLIINGSFYIPVEILIILET